MDTCLAVVFTDVTAIGTNRARVLGNIKNNCGFTVVGGSFGMDGVVQFCGTNTLTKSGSDGFSFASLGAGQTQLFQAEVTGQCEVCEDGVPTDFPPFDLYIQASADGKNSSGTVEVESNVEENTVHGMPNSPNFAFPCP